ncbi:MAG: hypothetical protein AAB263_07370, partial [Planctomycetota bacterium]
MRILLLGFILLSTVAAADPRPQIGDGWPMHWRTWCDPAEGFSFRYPYRWMPVDMHRPLFNREWGTGGTATTAEQEITVGKRKIKVMGKAAAKPTDLDHDLLVFSQADGGDKLDDVGDKQARIPLTWTDYDYYRKDPARPHADPKFAPAKVTARLGTAADRCCLVIRHSERISGIVFAGPLTREFTQEIIDTAEVIYIPDPNPKAKKPPANTSGTWRERQAKLGKVVGPDGKLVDANLKGKPVPWKDGWELETEHYHITTHTSPARLMAHGAYFEALYRTYAGVYQPDRMPPMKCEVHIFDRRKDFGAASAAWGHGVGMSGGIVGGFFVPALLSLWVYEESGELGGSDFTVEHVSAHECSHQFLHMACTGSENVPTWVNEGLAVYFESGVFVENKFQERSPKERISRLQMAQEQTKGMLGKPDWYLKHKGHISADMYGEVFAMVHFWLFDCTDGCKHTNCGRSRFITFWKALRGGEEGDVAFER